MPAILEHDLSSLLKLIVTTMGESPRHGKDRLFAQIIDKTKTSERQIILLIDEAQMLSGEALIDLRLLLSSAIDEAPPLRLLPNIRKIMIMRRGITDNPDR